MISENISVFRRAWRVALAVKRSLGVRINLEIALFFSRDELKIIVGSSATRMSGWISTEYPCVDISDMRTLGRFLKESSVSNFFAEHVLEHLTAEQAVQASRNIYALLKKGGRWRIAVPDGFNPDPSYINQVRPGGWGEGSDDHKVLYDIDKLTELLTSTGFVVIAIEWFDHSGKFHFESWDAEEGMVSRSLHNDVRNQVKPYSYTSLIVDALKL